MFIVRRAFTSRGHRYCPGDLIDDVSVIKLAKCKINDKKIMVVPEDEQARKQLEYYFKEKIGVVVKLATEKKAEAVPKRAQPFNKAVTK